MDLMNPMIMNNNMNMQNLNKNFSVNNINNQIPMNNMMMNDNMQMNNMMMNNQMPINNMMMNDSMQMNNMMMNIQMPMNNMMNNSINTMMMNNNIINNNIPMNNMNNNFIPLNNIMNEQLLMNMQMINNNQILMNNPMNMNNIINDENLYKNNKNYQKTHKKKSNIERKIPLILQKNANRKIESITFKVEKGLKPLENLYSISQNEIFNDLFSKRKTINENGKLIHLNENEPMEILHYKFDSNEKQFFNCGKKSLIQGLIIAYKNHLPITITPDMIWLLVLQGFSRFMDKYNELVREKFVNFEGQKTLIIDRYGTPVNQATDETWDGIIDECVEQIGENIGEETVSNLQSDFTTTNAATLLASQASIMSAMKHYFKYQVAMGGCGISYITLEGSLEDWEKIKSKLIYISNFALKWWTKHLIPIIDKIIETKKYYEKKKKINNELIDFWKKIIRVKDNRAEYKPDSINGWIIKFIPELDGEHPKLYDELYEYEIPDEILNCPLKIVEDSSNGFKIEYECGIASGFFGMIQDKKSLSVKPVIGYAIVVENKKQSAMTLEEKETIIKNHFQ